MPILPMVGGEARPSRTDWDRLRPIIKRLYVDEDKKLADVMAIMARDYGHRATYVRISDMMSPLTISQD